VETVVWQWGPFSIAVFSLTFFAAILVALIIIFAEGRRKMLSEHRLIDFVILCLVGGIAGSRLAFALLFNRGYYLENPVYLLRLQDGGMSLWGGLTATFVILSIWAAHKNLVIERYLDAAAPALAAGLAIGQIGIALSGAPVPYALPWAIEVGGGQYHPDGAYAIVLLMSLLFIIWRRRTVNAYEGELFIWFLLGYALISLVLEFVRAAAPFLWIFSVGQLVSLVVIAFTLLFMLAGSKIIAVSAPYLHLNIFRKGSRLRGPFRVIWFVVLTGGMVALYYLARQPVNL
jgi:phosphatidylglycerol---prolipoprotein diacylglyceryl transferase